MVLAPGAGADAEHHTLVAVAERVAPLPVARIDFPYRRAGRRAPDRAPTLVACVVGEASALAQRTGVPAERIVLGGRSMGGRMCSMAVAEGLPAAGLILLSYPLHPPGRPERMRTEHFPSLRLPCLFVAGTRDPFGRPDEIEAATAAIPGPVTHVWLDGEGHEPKRSDDTIADAVAGWLAGSAAGGGGGGDRDRPVRRT
ncbi:MAG: dienelactone hydrolase [Actinobacteria bacterium]|nr:dienelactone hydrolase [Actinomycetota bacterium]